MEELRYCIEWKRLPQHWSRTTNATIWQGCCCNYLRSRCQRFQSALRHMPWTVLPTDRGQCWRDGGVYSWTEDVRAVTRLYARYSAAVFHESECPKPHVSCSAVTLCKMLAGGFWKNRKLQLGQCFTSTWSNQRIEFFLLEDTLSWPLQKGMKDGGRTASIFLGVCFLLLRTLWLLFLIVSVKNFFVLPSVASHAWIVQLPTAERKQRGQEIVLLSHTHAHVYTPPWLRAGTLLWPVWQARLPFCHHPRGPSWHCRCQCAGGLD